MKKVMFMFAMLVVLSSTVMAQKDTIQYEKGWVYGRSVEKTQGVYFALDSTGVKFKPVLTITEDSVKFNNEVYWVEASQDRGVSSPLLLKNCYLFFVQHKNGTKFYMYLNKVSNRNAHNKYHFILTKDWRDEEPMITEIIVKPDDQNNFIIDQTNKKEAKEKKWWFNKMYANR